MGFENGHLARATLHASDGTNEVVNTLHYDLIDSLVDDSPTLEGLAERLWDDLSGAYRTLFPTGWTISPIVVMDEIDPQNPFAVRDSAVHGTPLTATGGTIPTADQAPLEECVVATLLTGHIGRRFRGRMFLPPIFDESKTSGGVLASLYVSQYQSFLDDIPHEPDLVTGAGTGTAKWCVYSRTQRTENRDPYASAITSYQLRPRLRWLRSRGR